MRHFSVVWSLWLCIRLYRNNIKIALVRAMMAYRECRCVAPLFLNLDASCWRVVTITPWQPFSRGLGVLCKMKLRPDILITLDNKMIFNFLSHELKQINPIALFFVEFKQFFSLRQGFEVMRG